MEKAQDSQALCDFKDGELTLNGTVIEDTFAEAFKVWGTRLIVTAPTRHWVNQAALASTGFATSVIGCGCEAGIEAEISPEESPDGRPGVSLLFFGGWNDLAKQLLGRVGQTIMTCPGTACYRGISEGGGLVPLGASLRYFGDSYQTSKMISGIRYWRIPVMDGEFLVEDKVPLQRAVGGGNFLIAGRGYMSVLNAAERAVRAMRGVRGVIMPFPGGVVRSGSKVGSRYKFLGASSNTAYCPTLRPLVKSELPEGASSVLEIVIDGFGEEEISAAMRTGITAAAGHEIIRITAGNYGGSLGPFHFHLWSLFGFEPKPGPAENAGGAGKTGVS
jgi:formylmethanofuran--tetrahydromethanopterin N-formyltransferase